MYSQLICNCKCKNKLWIMFVFNPNVTFCDESEILDGSPYHCKCSVKIKTIFDMLTKFEDIPTKLNTARLTSVEYEVTKCK